MSKTKVVTSRKEGGETFYDFRCPYPIGCGVPDGEAFSSVGWTDREHAVARGKQHIAEHETGEAAPELHEFRVARGVTQKTAGQANRPTDWEF